MPYQHNRASGREKKQTNKQKQELGWKLEEEQHKDTIQNLKLSCVRVLTYWLNIDHIWSTRCRTKRKRGLNVNMRKQPTFCDATTGFPRNDVWETSAEIPYWWRVTKQIWVIDWSCRFNQSEALNTQLSVVTRHKHGISALVSQTSLCVETSCGVTKCRLFSLAIQT